MPSLFLSNVNRVCNKLDEISLLLNAKCPDIVVFTETWLDANIPDSLIDMPHYFALRKDRKNKMGGGVMMYIRNGLQFRLLDNVFHDFNHCDHFEIMWVLVRPRRLPREVSVIIVCIVYFPPWYSAAMNDELCGFIVKCVDHLRRKYPNACFLIAGDFNQVKTAKFNNHLHFTQVVKNPTRINNILDKIFTNCATFYKTPEILPPIGRSDHNCVLLSSTGVVKPAATYRTVTRRRLDHTTMNNIGRDLLLVRWTDMYKIDNCQQQADYFYATVENVFNNNAPAIEARIRSNDKPWINKHFKACIKKRDAAWKNNNTVLYRKLRNKVNRLRQSLKSQFFIDKVERLKVATPSDWWRNIKSLCGWSQSDSVCFEN